MELARRRRASWDATSPWALDPHTSKRQKPEAVPDHVVEQARNRPTVFFELSKADDAAGNLSCHEYRFRTEPPSNRQLSTAAIKPRIDIRSDNLTIALWRDDHSLGDAEGGRSDRI
jgi:hypothetical protein